MAALQAHGFDRLPLPGNWRTRERWAALAAVAASDLALAKLYEGHTDALAILAELGEPSPARGARGVWAAEPPQQRVTAMMDTSDALRIGGTKPWCSGATACAHALVTAWRDGESVLVAVDLAQPSIAIDSSRWRALGMAASGTADVSFDGALAQQIGKAGAYLARPGFWQGGAGIAACWFGCAEAIARALRDGLSRRHPPRDPHALAHLGAVDARLGAVAALLRDTADWIDQSPHADARNHALRARIAVEAAVLDVAERAGRALGAMPFCGDPWFARAMADLTVFVRQSHAERDEASPGDALLDDDIAHWRLDGPAPDAGAMQGPSSTARHGVEA